MNRTPPGSMHSCNSSGWLNIEIFSQRFNHFLSHTARPSFSNVSTERKLESGIRKMDEAVTFFQIGTLFGEKRI